jgi:uncharacterized membrane protein
MAILKKDLNALRNDFKALEKKLGDLLKAAGTTGKAPKAKAVKKATAKKVATKKAAVKKAPAKKIAAKKAPAKKTAVAKKAKPETATDQILMIIKRSKNGVDVPTLKKKTGFDDKKVRNIVFRAAKEGRIKKSGRGNYVGG